MLFAAGMDIGLMYFAVAPASEGRRSTAWFLAAQTNDEARVRDLTGFTVDQIAADILTQLERWRLGS